MSEHVEQRSVPGFLGYIVRFIVTAIVLSVASFFVPGFTVASFWTALVAAVVISLVDYGIEMAFSFDAAPLGRGIKGFIVSAAIIFLAQYLVPNMSVTIVGALIAALVVGILDAIIPGRMM